MLGEIIVTSPHKESTKVFEKFKNEMDDINVTILETSFEDAISVVKGVLFQYPQRNWVIISGGATERLIANELKSVPTVSIEPTEYDVLLAIDNARLYGGKIGLFLGRTENLHVIEKISNLLGLPIKVYVYYNWHDLEVQVEKAIDDGIEVIVGVGERIGALVRQEGLNYVSVLAGKNTIRSSLERARDILIAEHKVKMNAERVNTIAAYSNEGIIAINEDNILTVFNPVALKFFGLKEAEVLGRPLASFGSNKSLIDIFEGPEKKLGFLQNIRNKNVLVNKVPILDSKSSRGFLVTLKEVISVQKDEKVSRELLLKGLVAKYTFDDIIHNDINMDAVITKARRYANTDSTVLIRGESGTGKELFAQGIHNGSVRSKKPFFAVNCASLDDNLLRAELFGYTEGAFTGASKGGKPGLFELSQGGSLFLDEIGKMKLELQAHLLRVLQEKEVRRIGSDRVIPVDVRVIAASNEDLKDLVYKGAFREDLYFRLNVLKLNIPPLRERRGDIPDLVNSFLRKNSGMYDKKIFTLPPSVLRNIANMNWPGNVRQLEHFIERCVVLADDEIDAPGIIMELLEEEFGLNITADDENSEINKNHISIPIGTLSEMSAEIVRKMSEMSNVTNSELALKLGISRPTLLKILNQNKKLHIRSVE